MKNIGLILGLILMINGCGNNSKTMEEISVAHDYRISDNTSCENDVTEERKEGDNTILTSNGKIAGYCYIGYDS
jgi:PBP1b-binding outer membrane lipoprotein LpoB